jgi:hypothetical protein
MNYLNIFFQMKVNFNSTNILKSKLKKELYIHPLSQDNKNSEKYKKQLNKLFNDPNHYFTTVFNGTQIIVGKKLSNITYHNSIPLIQTKSTKKNLISRNRSSQMGFIRLNSKSFRISSRQSQNNIPNLKQNQKYIDNTSLKHLFENYKRIELKNKKKKITINSQNLIQKEISQIFNLQKKTLNKLLSEDNNKNKIISKILKKTKRPKKDILMERVDSFRIKKEFLNQIQDENNKISQKPILSWNTSLRYSKGSDNNYFINVGIKNPKWCLFKNKNDDINNKEIIRHPSYNNEVYKNKSLRNFFHNEYLKKKFPKSYSYLHTISDNENNTMNNINNQTNNNDYNDYSESYYPNDIHSLYVKGENLLSFEFENSKLLRGKKILNFTQNSPDDTKDFIFKEIVDSPFKSSLGSKEHSK